MGTVLVASVAAAMSCCAAAAAASAWMHVRPPAGNGRPSPGRTADGSRHPELEALCAAVVAERLKTRYPEPGDSRAASRAAKLWDGRVVEMPGGQADGRYLGMTDMRTVYVASKAIRRFDPKNAALPHHTALHELAHIASGKGDHGREWERQLCLNGLAARRTPLGRAVKGLFDEAGCRANHGSLA